MSEPDAPLTTRTKWKILEKKVGDKWPIFTGDFSYLNEVLAEKPSNSGWLILQFLNALCRSFGQVIFANNPISGVIIMLAIGIADYLALLAGIFASSASFIFSLVFHQDPDAILNGGFGYNPVLHGVVSVGALPSIYPEINAFPPRFWLFLIITVIMSIYTTSAFNNIFKNMGQYPVPCFTLPFNIVQFILIYCLLHNSMPSQIVSHHVLIAPASRNLTFSVNDVFNGSLEKETVNGSMEYENHINNHGHLNWGETFSGTIVALSQVYGLNNVPCAALMYLALFVYSPLMTGFAYLGALLGTLLGTLFTTNALEIYSGAWGYNGLLCSAALGGFCFALNFQSTVLAVASIIFTTALQHVLNPAFVMMGFPVLTMPFNITTILFLFITTDKERNLCRPSSITFPEKHRHQYKHSSTEKPQQGYLRKSQVSFSEDVREEIC